MHSPDGEKIGLMVTRGGPKWFVVDMNPPKSMHGTTWNQQNCETTESLGAENFCEKLFTSIMSFGRRTARVVAAL
jgi:hypothetical protein